MNETITLGVGGDINLIKNRILSNPDCVFPISIKKTPTEEKITYLSFEYNDDIKILDRYLNVLSEYIIERYEPRFLKRILDESHSYLSPVQKREVLKNTSVLADDPEIGYEARKRSVLLSLYDYLKEEHTMLLDGFISFRLKDYEQLLGLLAERLIDDYAAKKEYEEFIELLRYFVNIQRPRPEFINLVINIDGRYNIIDEARKDITSKCLREFTDSAVILTESDYDDILISILITIAPKRIIVHGSRNIRNKELFLTIKRVFDEVKYCTGCEICSEH